MLFAGEPLLLGRRDNLAVHYQRGGAVVIKRRDAKDIAQIFDSRVSCCRRAGALFGSAPNNSSSTNSQNKWPTAMWHSWIRAVLEAGTTIARSTQPANSPPSLPDRPIVLSPRRAASLT